MSKTRITSRIVDGIIRTIFGYCFDHVGTQSAGLHRKKMPGVRPSHAIKSKLNFLACDSRTPYNLWRAMLKKYFFTNVTP